MKQTALYSINPSTCDNEVRAIDYGAIIYSHTGTATIRINFDHWELKGESVLILFPGDVISFKQMDDNFSAHEIRYCSDILREASLNVEHAVYDTLKADRRCGYPQLINEVVYSMFRIFTFYFTVEHYSMTDRIVALQLQAFFLGFYDYLKSHPHKDLRDKGTQRTDELFNQFMNLMEHEFRQGHEVNYYALRMNISRKYLSMIVGKKTGKSPKRIIDEYITLRLKLAMQTTKCSLKQIAHEFCFSDQSTLTRYFRTHTGISPQQFRLMK